MCELCNLLDKFDQFRTYHCTRCDGCYACEHESRWSNRYNCWMWRCKDRVMRPVILEYKDFVGR